MTGKYCDCVPQLSSSAVAPAVFAVAVVLLLPVRAANVALSVFKEEIDLLVPCLRLGVAFFSHPSLPPTLRQVHFTRAGKKISCRRV